jgi:hypothetical protein
MSKKEANSKRPASDQNTSFFKKTRKKEYPYCFGKLETVFPLAEDGLRHTPESCMICRTKTECLRAALKKNEGLKVQAEKVDRAYASGMMGFLERWSKKKSLDRQMKKNKQPKGQKEGGSGENH